MKKLLPFIRLLHPHRDWALLAVVAGILTLLASIGLLAVSGWFLSGAAIAGFSMATIQAFNLHTPSAGLRGFALLRTLARYAERVISHEATLRLLSSLRVWFYKKIEPQAPANLYRYRSGDLLSRIVTDIDILDNLFVRVLLPTVAALVVAAALGCLLWFLSPVLAGVYFCFFLLAGIALPLTVGWVSHRIGSEIQQQQGVLRSNLVEDLHGIADLKIYGASRNHVEQRLAESDRLLLLQEKMAAISGASTALLALFGGLAALFAVYVAIPLAAKGLFSEPVLAFIGFGILAAFESIQPLPLAYQMLGKIHTAAERLIEVSETPAAVTFPTEKTIKPAEFTVSFREVSFIYPNLSTQPVVDAVSLMIPAKTTTVLVGPSGSGKTTLAHLLTRFWDPDQGTISVGSSDLRLFTEEQLRSMVTMVSQKAHIFSGTLRENLLIARPDCDELQLHEALDSAQLSDFVASLPEGLDTWVGENGSQLSGGEARRLVLARALLKNAPIWILDEPTEGLDNITRRLFTETIFENLAGRCGLFITHTREALERVDQVCFMENGRILACGAHTHLLSENQRYRHFITNQQ